MSLCAGLNIGRRGQRIPFAVFGSRWKICGKLRSHDNWQQGGNGEAVLDAGPSDAKLWIKQPEPARFFLTYSTPGANWLVPYGGESCESLVRDERGLARDDVARLCDGCVWGLNAAAGMVSRVELQVGAGLVQAGRCISDLV